ncbi:MAG: UDP-N-acetylglucosamine 2-epimerase [Candidatus Rifleibacteriota bacterium]
MSTKVLIITGSRAEWGILRPLYFLMANDSFFRPMLLVTGSHLAREGDNSLEEIRRGQVRIDYQLPIFPEEAGLSNQQAMFMAMANLNLRLPDALSELKPDLAIVLGDRFEIFTVAKVCRLAGVKLAHISGGEITRGAVDDCFRHCITKLSDLHFTATEAYRNRVIQLGENPQQVFNIGEPGLYRLSEFPFLSEKELEEQLELKISRPVALLTMHSETCHQGLVSSKIEEILQTLLNSHKRLQLICTAANSDPEGEIINRVLEETAARNSDRMIFCRNLGRQRYLSLAKQADFIVGNSSSGIVEIPALGVPVINIGQRQAGRPHGESVVDCDFYADNLRRTIEFVMQSEFREKARTFAHPYEGEKSLEKMVEILRGIDLAKIRTDKVFYDL